MLHVHFVGAGESLSLHAPICSSVATRAGTYSLCGSSIIVNKKLFNNKITKLMNLLSLVIIIITVIGRLLSGVHWFTDIIGGIFISIALLMTLYSLLDVIKRNN